MSSSTSTSIPSISTSAPPVSTSLGYTLIDDAEYSFEEASSLPKAVFANTCTFNSGDGISRNLGHYTIGNFYIDCDLLEPHSCQRPIDKNHAELLHDQFTNQGILRDQNPGVVIGNGPGWMKIKTSHAYKITSQCSFLSELRLSPGGPIGQVIRGGHRTKAIKLYSDKKQEPEENFWLYTVFIPGNIIYLSFIAVFLT